MGIYLYLQWLKDFIAIPIFIWFALTPSIYENTPLLSLLFSLGGFIDAMYVSSTMYYRLKWTISSVKDALGALGMLVFSMVIIFAPETDCPSNWNIFFILATYIDLLSVISPMTPFNIYTWNLI